jgi:hypothetical protein
MYQINFKEPIHIYFIGIGGISMSGLAEIVKKENFKVSGSDMKESALTNHLNSLGIQVSVSGLRIYRKTLMWWYIQPLFMKTILNMQRL